MNVFRIAKDQYIRDLTGEGARKYGGRWNRKGTNVLYTAEHESLAVLEMLVHATMTLLPKDLKLLVLSIPPDVSSEKIYDGILSANWREYPAPPVLAKFGSEWVNSKKSLLLYVPSVIVPTEFNILINPYHQEFSQIKEKEIRDLLFDERLGKKIIL